MWLYLAIFGVLVFSVCGENDVGDTCNVRGNVGTCTLFDDCPSAAEDLHKRGIWPTRCGFFKNQPIVCCPRSMVPGAISKKKCEEYAQYQFTKYRSPLAFINAPPVIRNECGHHVVKLIIGGEKAEEREFPHMAAIGYNTTENQMAWNCGGTIVSERYILTAAHCLGDHRYGNATLVKVGVRSLEEIKHSQTIEVEELIPHEGYQYPAYYHDIGLIKLKRSIKLNSRARPACLYTESKLSNEKAIATGWGITSTTGEQTSDLMKVVLEMVDNDKCDNEYASLRSRKLRSGILEEIQLCADGGANSTEIKDTCNGDSGGPLQIYHPGAPKCMYDIIGITSFGKRCFGTAGIYTRVSNYIKWIEDHVWKEEV